MVEKRRLPDLHVNFYFEDQHSESSHDKIPLDAVGASHKKIECWHLE
jgi:hypothetical protein